jgi:hypothetical protein
MGTYKDLRVTAPWQSGDEVKAARVNAHATNSEMRADGETITRAADYGHAMFFSGSVQTRAVHYGYQFRPGALIIVFPYPFREPPLITMLLKRGQGHWLEDRNVNRKRGIPSSGAIPGWVDKCYDWMSVSAHQITRYGFTIAVDSNTSEPDGEIDAHTYITWQAIGV